jgi:hypothetical protein
MDASLHSAPLTAAALSARLSPCLQPSPVDNDDDDDDDASTTGQETSALGAGPTPTAAEAMRDASCHAMGDAVPDACSGEGEAASRGGDSDSFRGFGV